MFLHTVTPVNYTSVLVPVSPSPHKFVQLPYSYYQLYGIKDDELAMIFTDFIKTYPAVPTQKNVGRHREQTVLKYTIIPI
jgi:hypothetical protein